MSSFFDRILGKKIEQDSQVAFLESRLSFELAQVDKYLLDKGTELGAKSAYTEILGDLLQMHQDRKNSVGDEINCLERYIAAAKSVHGEQFFIQFNAKVESKEAQIEPLILFPIVQNAIRNGYTSMEKYPIKIRVSATETGLLLEVSNRVNHYVVSQAEDELITLYRTRLKLEYPGKHDLFLNSNSNTFKATLFLKF